MNDRRVHNGISTVLRSGASVRLPVHRLPDRDFARAAHDDKQSAVPHGIPMTEWFRKRSGWIALILPTAISYPEGPR